MKKPPEVIMLVTFLLLFASTGLGAGLLFMIDPTGDMLWMHPKDIERSPFHSYFIPGLLLFIFMGALPLMATIGLLFKPHWKWADVFNIYDDKHWSWTYTLYSGLILIIWIAIQTMMVAYLWIQPIMILTGVLIIILIMLPPIQEYYKAYKE